MNIVLNGNMNESSSKAGKGFYPNTELGIDLKLMTSVGIDVAQGIIRARSHRSAGCHQGESHHHYLLVNGFSFKVLP